MRGRRTVFYHPAAQQELEAAVDLSGGDVRPNFEEWLAARRVKKKSRKR